MAGRPGEGTGPGRGTGRGDWHQQCLFIAAGRRRWRLAARDAGGENTTEYPENTVPYAAVGR